MDILHAWNEHGEDWCAMFNACAHITAASAAESKCNDHCPTREVDVDVSSFAQEVTGRQGTDGAEPLDIRVALAFGTKPYAQVRLSVITNAAPTFNTSAFDYSAKFKYKWTDNSIHTRMMAVDTRFGSPVTIGSTSFDVKLPARGDGVVGLLVGDPCVRSGSVAALVDCVNADNFKTTTRTPALLNQFVGGDNATDFWGILGDNFYDKSGGLTRRIFAELSVQTKAKPMITVPGNHDYWVLGSPQVGQKSDQYANGTPRGVLLNCILGIVVF
jgi:hypothetical protein